MPTVLATTESFNEAIKGNQISVVHFGAEFVEQCGQVNDVLDALSSRPEYSNIKFFQCQAEDLSEVSLKHKIEAAPTVLIFRSSKAIDRIDGADPAQITNKLKAHISAVNSEIADTKPLEERLKALINKGSVMLFMKGDRNTPRCGFSRDTIKILNQSGVNYETFDILSDDEVRQGLKTYSDWPTYPQLYVKGELVGGLDIIKELEAGGELLTTLNG